MTNYQEIIRGFVTDNPNPDINFIPTLVLISTGSNRLYGDYTRYYLPNEGLIYFNDNSSFKDSKEYHVCNMLSPNKYNNYWDYARFFYARFHETHDMLELGIVKINALHPNKKLMMDKRSYSWDSSVLPRVFIFTDHKTVYDAEGNQLWSADDGKYYNRQLLKRLRDMYNLVRRPHFYFWNAETICKEEFNKFLTATKADNIKYNYEFFKGYQRAYPRPESKKAKVFKTSIEATLKPISDYTDKFTAVYTKEKKPGWSWALTHIGDINWIAEKIDDDNYVLREFCMSNNSKGIISDTYELATTPKPVPNTLIDMELSRIYIKSDGTYSIKMYVGGEWVTKNLNCLYWNSDSGYIDCDSFEKVPFIAEEFKIVKERLENKEEIKKYGINRFIRLLLRLIRNPMALQLKKEGLDNLFYQFAVLENNKALYCHSKSKDLYKYTKLNKEQLQLLDDTCMYLRPLCERTTLTLEDEDLKDDGSRWYYGLDACVSEIIEVMHSIFSDLSTIDIKTFNLYYRRLLYIIPKRTDWKRRFFGETTCSNTNYLFNNVKKMIETTKDDNSFFESYIVAADNHFYSLPWDNKYDQKFFDSINTKKDLLLYTE